MMYSLAQNVLNADTYIPIGIASTVVVALIACTWRISSQMTKGIVATASLENSVKGLSATMNGHILESNNRDRQNDAAHNMLNGRCDTGVEALRAINHRLTRVENQSDTSDKAIAQLDKRLAVVESE